MIQLIRERGNIKLKIGDNHEISLNTPNGMRDPHWTQGDQRLIDWLNEHHPGSDEGIVTGFYPGKIGSPAVQGNVS